MILLCRRCCCLCAGGLHDRRAACSCSCSCSRCCWCPPTCCCCCWWWCRRLLLLLLLLLASCCCTASEALHCHDHGNEGLSPRGVEKVLGLASDVVLHSGWAGAYRQQAQAQAAAQRHRHCQYRSPRSDTVRMHAVLCCVTPQLHVSARFLALPAVSLRHTICVFKTHKTHYLPAATPPSAAAPARC